MRADYDVIVCGGGLAGLTLAYQLRNEVPDAKIAVIERQKRPLPEAAHKVGESSVELASHYFGEVLGLRPYLLDNHLKKNGLRFICGDTQGPVEERPEIGPSEFPTVPSYQLDRGKLENDLRAMIEEKGATLLEGRSVKDIVLAESDDAPHVVQTSEGDLTCKWVVDATGRLRILQKKLGHRRPSPNKSSAVWFRVRERVLVGELVPKDKTEWHQRDVDQVRWLSTVHLMGKGYWLWLIPLSTGYTSIGIVCHDEHQPFTTYNTKEKALAWIAKNEPRVMERIEGLELEDFCMMPNYSYLTDRFASSQRWSCVGEAAAFVDPLYSLGSDFISMSNSYTTRFVGEYLRGELQHEVVEELNQIYCRLAEDAARTLSNNGRIFPHGDLMGAKLWWDFFNYWSFMCAHFFQGIWRQDAATLKKFRAMQARFYQLNSRAQTLLETWAELKATPFGGPKGFVGLPSFPSTLADAHVELKVKRTVDETYAKMERDLKIGQELVTEILAHALRDLGSERAAELGRRIGLSLDWDLPLGGERFAVDDLPRRQRVDALPRIARDMERALGRVNGDKPLRELLDLALAAGASAPQSAPSASV